MRTRVYHLVAPMLLATLAIGAQAQGRGRGPDGGRGGPPGAACFGTADSLADSQKDKIRALSDAFAKAHQPQLDTLRAIMDAVRAARAAGKSPEEIRAIMDQGKATRDALAPFQKIFRETVVTYLTPAQIAAGCIPPAPPGGPPGGPGGRRGGRPPNRG